MADLTQQPKITLQPEVIPARVMEVAQRLTMVVQVVTDLAQVQGQALVLAPEQALDLAPEQAQGRGQEVTAAEEPERATRAVAEQPLQV
ncbi:hypothetical protein JFY47_17775 [Enterobacter asburiae]|uniref:hypothetical protein n=1 Tax=Enterobacter asburiae TaxID=61645 RepID=UPI0018E9B3FA|nr:hypothetical protein [Enterobacter asburiae]MBJ3782370.1 hypothetical protein [Enterobacter asburiae]